MGAFPGARVKDPSPARSSGGSHAGLRPPPCAARSGHDVVAVSDGRSVTLWTGTDEYRIEGLLGPGRREDAAERRCVPLRLPGIFMVQRIPRDRVFERRAALYNRPKLRRLATPCFPTIRESCSAIFMMLSARSTCWLKLTSASDGVGSPEGWL
jgi:hypothetical protein